MATLASLKLVAAKKPTNQPPVVQRRNKLSSKVFEQIQLARAQSQGEAFTPTKHKTVTNADGEFDSSDEEINHQSLRLSWKSKDTTAYKFQHIEEAPFWLASSSGIGLIQEINKCLTTVANAGSNTASFALEILPQITDRWGSNEMTKVTFDSKPIGVFPFTHEVFVQLITKLGFSATIKSDSEKTKLQISW